MVPPSPDNKYRFRPDSATVAYDQRLPQARRRNTATRSFTFMPATSTAKPLTAERARRPPLTNGDGSSSTTPRPQSRDEERRISAASPNRAFLSSTVLIERERPRIILTGQMEEPGKNWSPRWKRRAKQLLLASAKNAGGGAERSTRIRYVPSASIDMLTGRMGDYMVEETSAQRKTCPRSASLNVNLRSNDMRGRSRGMERRLPVAKNRSWARNSTADTPCMRSAAHSPRREGLQQAIAAIPNRLETFVENRNAQLVRPAKQTQQRESGWPFTITKAPDSP